MALGIRKVSIFTVTFSAATVWIGFFAWRIMFNNFAVEVFNASATDIGFIQATREIPGLLAFGVGAIAIRFTESKIAAVSILMVGAGLILCGLSPTILALGLATGLMSLGFHYFEPTNSSQLLALSDRNGLGHAQGKLQSYESLAGLIGAAIVLSMTAFLDYRSTFYLIGGMVGLIGLYLIFALPANRTRTEHRKIRIKKKYWLYYTLSFLRGCRRHIFTTFAIFLLVKLHGLSITAVSALMLVNCLITMFTNRLLGKLSDTLGERQILVGCSFLLVFIFTGYAFVDFLPLLIACYLVDNVLFGSSMALRSYLTKISTPEDLTSCLSFGMTSNHITAVIVPILGGVMWQMFGHKATFLAGTAIVAIDMFLAMKVPGDLPSRG
jgi:predicted MFS family arabinose efflux permease